MATDWNRQIIEEFHAKQGRGVGPFGDRLLLLTTTGRRSGQKRTTPVASLKLDDGDLLIIASKGGAPANPLWYENLVTNPEVEVEVPADGTTETFRARAMPIAGGEERDQLYARMVAVMPGFADYEKKTDRVIPVVRLSRRD